jgi:hypothetical protein
MIASRNGMNVAEQRQYFSENFSEKMAVTERKVEMDIVEQGISMKFFQEVQNGLIKIAVNKKRFIQYKILMKEKNKL